MFSSGAEELEINFNVFKCAKLIEGLRQKWNELKTCADAWTTLHAKTIRLLLLGKNE